MKACQTFIAFLCVLAGVCNAFSDPLPTRAFVRGQPSKLGMTVLTYNGKKKNFPPGSPLEKAVAQLGVPVKYSCRKGDCATCQVTLAGRYTKPCVAKVPAEPKLKSLQEKGLEIRV